MGYQMRRICLEIGLLNVNICEIANKSSTKCVHVIVFYSFSHWTREDKSKRGINNNKNNTLRLVSKVNKWIEWEQLSEIQDENGKKIEHIYNSMQLVQIRF